MSTLWNGLPFSSGKSDSTASRCNGIIERGLKRLGVSDEALARARPVKGSEPTRRVLTREARPDAEIDRLCALVVEEWRAERPDARSIYRWCRKYDLNFKRVKAALVAAGEIKQAALGNDALSPLERRQVVFAWRALPVKRLVVLAHRFGRSESTIAKVLSAAGVYEPRRLARRKEAA